MLWVYDQHKYVDSYSAGIDFSRQILTTKVDPGTVRVNLFYWQVKSQLLGV